MKQEIIYEDEEKIIIRTSYENKKDCSDEYNHDMEYSMIGVGGKCRKCDYSTL